MEEDLVTRLTGVAGISAIVGAQVSWFWFQRGETGGRIALSMISPGESWTHEGPDGLPHPRVQIDCRHEDPDTLAALKRLVVAEMQTESIAGGTKFHPAELAGEQGVNEGEQDGGLHSYRASLDFIFYHEANPV